jgi:hypothetical protein
MRRFIRSVAGVESDIRKFIHVSRMIFRVPVYEDQITYAPDGTKTIEKVHARNEVHVQDKGRTYFNLERTLKRHNRKRFFKERREARRQVANA